MYQFVMLKAQLHKPFMLYTVLPRAAIPLSEVSVDSVGIGGSLLTCEEDTTLDFTDFFMSLRDTVIITSDDDVPDNIAEDQTEDKATPWSNLIIKAEEYRAEFVATHYKRTSCESEDQVLKVDRKRIYNEAITQYSNHLAIANIVPIVVVFDGEAGVDLGGLSRDFFSGFWEEAYIKMFDGAAQLAPVIHADVDMSHYSVLGRILSHGYLCCGFLLTRLAFPVLALVLLGCSISVPPEILVHSFVDLLSQVERKTVASAIAATEFSDSMKTSLINILSRFGCREAPSPNKLSQVLCTLAQHHFVSHPFAALSKMNAGVPDKHKEFWSTLEVDHFHSLYEALTASPEKVLEQISEPIFENPNEERVFGYLQHYVGEMKVTEAKHFLRFVTGSSVLSRDPISICFNALDGAARRPIAHTCSHLLELSNTNCTFLEFAEEFTTILSNEDSCWNMYSI